jgi:hypothetical protein
VPQLQRHARARGRDLAGSALLSEKAGHGVLRY